MSESDWIPVSERLPEASENASWSAEVLVWPRANNSPVATYYYPLQRWEDGEGNRVDGITHWQPLPDGPA